MRMEASDSVHFSGSTPPPPPPKKDDLSSLLNLIADIPSSFVPKWRDALRDMLDDPKTFNVNEFNRLKKQLDRAGGRLALVDRDLSGWNLKGINFHNVIFCNVVLSNANLRYAQLTQAEFHGGNLRGAYLGGANLENAYVNGVDLKGTIFYGAKGLKSIRNLGYALNLAQANGLSWAEIAPRS